jgi:hypothetical protein
MALLQGFGGWVRVLGDRECSPRAKPHRQEKEQQTVP